MRTSTCGAGTCARHVCGDSCGGKGALACNWPAVRPDSAGAENAFLLVVVIVLVACSVLVVALSVEAVLVVLEQVVVVGKRPRKQAKPKKTIAHDEPQVAIESLRTGDLPIQIKHEAEPPLRLQLKSNGVSLLASSTLPNQVLLRSCRWVVDSLRVQAM